MRINKILMVLLIFSSVLFVGCQQKEAIQPGAITAVAGDSNPVERFRTGELDQLSTLALGTLLLEDSENEVTPDQAANLLPLWQVIQGGNLKSQAETDAVLHQIESKLTDSQLNAIEDMELTREGMTTWMEEQGLQQGGFGDGSGGFGQMGDISEEDRAAMREQIQAMQDLTPEERREKMTELGFEMPEGADVGGGIGAAGGTRGGNLILNPLLDLLSARAVE
ncbi:MAG: hypothetical protein P1S60_04630 [Anaerolineae bacterium]|nr:hypothetical protein [Anaerolineae bacterium]